MPDMLKTSKPCVHSGVADKKAAEREAHGASASDRPMKTRIIWRKLLSNEPICDGDFMANYDMNSIVFPNSLPSPSWNQICHPCCGPYFTDHSSGDLLRQHGWNFWRPLYITTEQSETEVVYTPDDRPIEPNL